MKQSLAYLKIQIFQYNHKYLGSKNLQLTTTLVSVEIPPGLTRQLYRPASSFCTSEIVRMEILTLFDPIMLLIL